MSSTTATGAASGLPDRFLEFFRNYYREEIGQLAQRYPSEKRSLHVDYDDLFRFDRGLAEDYLTAPERVQPHATEALRLFDLPGDIALEDAHVRVHNVPADITFYPGGFSPTDRAGEYVTVEGQLERATETYSRIVEAAFECKRCGTLTFIAQDDSGFQEPHECAGCERQGPFTVDLDQSALVDAQKLRLQEPPEVAKGGNASTIDVFIEDDLVETADPGDKVAVSGILHLEQQTANNSKTPNFTPYLEGQDVIRKEAEFEDIEIDATDRERIERVADPTEGNDIYELAVDSIAPGIQGEDDIKLAMFLQLVSGVRTELPDGTAERGDVHVLLIGDPSTGKSKLMDAAEAIAPRSISVSGHGASASGLTAAAVRDDFGDGQWTLKAGALVHAHGGLACVDELDKISPDAVKSMHRALAQQRIPVNKAGINATLPSETALLAAANPKHGRWDGYTDDHEQITVEPALLSRFGLIWKLQDRPNEERDRDIARTVLESIDTAKRVTLEDRDVDDGARDRLEPALSPEFLRKYIAYARSNYTPVFRDDGVREKMESAYVTLRGINGYDDDAAVPVTARSIHDARRLAEASARARLSPVIEEQDVERAQTLLGKSLRQFATNDDGDLDADTIETGVSKSQKERIADFEDLIRELQPDSGGLALGTFIEEATDRFEMDRRAVKNQAESMIEKGHAYEPGGEGTIRVFRS